MTAQSSPTLWCLCRFSRPELLPNVLANYDCQSYPSRRLVIVANGAAKDDALDRRVDRSDVILLRSRDGIVAPFNVGLEWLRRHADPHDWVCWWDDDDLYCKTYLEPIASVARAGALAASRPVVWMRSTEGELWQSGGEGRHHGPTLASRLDATVPIPDNGRSLGEDGDWVLEMQKRGVVFAECPVDGFCWMRHEHRHACPLDTEAFRQLAAIERYYGPFDRRVVEGVERREPTRPTRPPVDHDRLHALLARN